MTISKKLLLIAPFVFSTSFVAQAFVGVDYERGCIFTFTAQNLSPQNSTKMHSIAGWLNNKAIGYDENKIITIANIINNPALTTESKITLFDEMIQKEKRINRNNTISQIAQAICAGILLAGFAGLTIWAIIEDIKNPRPIFYTVANPRPSVTVTWKKSGGILPDVTYNYGWPYGHLYAI